jgi:hypothetical protein
VLGGLLTWSWQGAATAFFWGTVVRVGLLHHVTWSINSICHAVGERPFVSRDKSGQRVVAGDPVGGESWHNLHHADPTCARHGVLRGQLTPPPARSGCSRSSAGSATSAGRVRCTKVGTAGNDKLVGTSSRDVICGRGGNDSITGSGGNDVIDGGAGNDVLSGGSGNDAVIGGSGNDAETGGSGDDSVKGGTGADRLSGNDGADHLYGQDGNDDLAGGTGTDSLAGGAGTNWCTIDKADTRTACVHDVAVPVAHQIAYSQASVDVSDAPASVRLRMHLTDDTGISSVQASVYDTETSNQIASGMAGLSSGTVRDGWWTLTVYVPRWMEPGDYEAGASITDRVHRDTYHDWFSPTLSVIDRHPDSNPPAVTGLSAPILDQSYDVRTSARTVRVKAALTDDASGIADATFCLFRPVDHYFTNLPCEQAALASGTRRDGVWTADIVIHARTRSTSWSRPVGARAPDLDLAPVEVFSRISRLARHLDLARRRGLQPAFTAHGVRHRVVGVRRAGGAAARGWRRTSSPPGGCSSETLVTSGTMTNRVDRLAARGFRRAAARPRRPARRDRAAHARGQASPSTARSRPCSTPSASCSPTCPPRTTSSSPRSCAP